MVRLINTLEGGTDATALTLGNSGGDSGDALEPVLGTGASVAYRAASALRGAMGARITLGSTSTYLRWTRAEASARAVCRMPLKVPAGATLPDQTIFQQIWGQAGGQGGYLALKANRGIRLANGSSEITASESPPITDEQYWCELAITKHNGTTPDGRAEMRILNEDESLFHTWDAEDVLTTANGLAQYRFGGFASVAGFTTLDLDDLQADGLATPDTWLGSPAEPPSGSVALVLTSTGWR